MYMICVQSSYHFIPFDSFSFVQLQGARYTKKGDVSRMSYKNSPFSTMLALKKESLMGKKWEGAIDSPRPEPAWIPPSVCEPYILKPITKILVLSALKACSEQFMLRFRPIDSKALSLARCAFIDFLKLLLPMKVGHQLIKSGSRFSNLDNLCDLLMIALLREALVVWRDSSTTCYLDLVKHGSLSKSLDMRNVQECPT